ncbi:MAG: helix-turn-helix transcriptional regulator [Thermomicrobiales bacterium]
MSGPGRDSLQPAHLPPTPRAGRLPLIGREDELARLRSAVDAGMAGGPRVVLLAGEAGIGKTRLLDEVMRLVTDGRTALGRCADERGMPPYLPWIDALADLDDRAGRQSSDARLQDLLLEADVDSDAPRLAGGPSPEQRKLRLFDRVTRALADLARATPVLIAFDDLQWSDEASNELLRYVALHLPTIPLAIVGTYRLEETAANPGLSRTIEEMNRRRLLTTIRVGPLTADETEQLLDALGGPRYRDLATTIYRLSDGNPFYVEEVVRALVDEGWLDPADASTALPTDVIPLPQGVVAVIQRRLERVGDSCRAVLECAALAGRAISVDLIAAATEQSPDTVADLCDEAVRAALVRLVMPDETAAARTGLPIDFEFLHDRVRESIAAGINPVRRRGVHARLAAALEAGGGADDDLARLAALTHHWQHARQGERAARFAELLGDAAIRAHAYIEAARAYRLAVDLVPAATDHAAGRSRGDLLLKLGDAALAMSAAEAIDAYAAAERAFAADGDDHGAARALHGLGSAHARREELDLAVAYLEAAVTALERCAPEADALTEALVEIGTILGTGLGRYDDAIRVGRRALELSTRDRALPAREANARLALGKTLLRAGNLAEGREMLAPALPIALQAAATDLAADVAGALSSHAYWTGDLDASERFARRRRELAVASGDPFALRHTLPWLAMIALARGDWADAERLLAEAEADVARVDSPEPRAFLRQVAGVLAFRRGRYDEAVGLLEEAIAGFRVSGAAALPWYLGWLAHAYLAAGDEASAERVASETAELVAALPAPSLPRVPALSDLGLYAARIDDAAAMRHWYDELLPYAGQFHWILVDRVLGVLAAAIGDAAAADRHFAAARTVALRGGIRPELALVAAERSALRLRAAAPADRASTEQELRDAILRLTTLDMTGDAARLAVALPGPRDYPAGLTEREVAVLRLVAQGLTNREIGDRLFISEKTVTNHLTHIFTKANVENRAAAVSFAHRHGLA